MNLKAALKRKKVSDAESVIGYDYRVVGIDEAYEMLDKLKTGEYVRIYMVFKKRWDRSWDDVEITYSPDFKAFKFEFMQASIRNDYKTKKEAFDENMSAIMIYKITDRVGGAIVDLIA